MQHLLVALIVAGCSLYAAWRLMPAAARRGLARLMLRGAHWPATVRGWLTRHAAAPTGCGCNGCERGASAPRPSAGTMPIRIHRRSSR